MAIQLSATDIHLTSATTNFPNRNTPFSVCCWVNSSVWGTAGNTASMVGVYQSGATAVQIGTRGNAQQVDVWS